MRKRLVSLSIVIAILFALIPTGIINGLADAAAYPLIKQGNKNYITTIPKSSSEKWGLLSSKLFYNSRYYNNDLAIACATLCCDVDDLSGYFPSGQVQLYALNIDDNAFHVAVGYKTIFISGMEKNLISIVFRGTGSFYEMSLDFLKDIKHWDFQGEEALNGPYMFKVLALQAMNEFISTHQEVKDHPLVYLVTGYSIGGAAANLLGAELTNLGGNGQSNVFVYTFGAIKAIASSANTYDGYDNIYNIYNYYDSWGPNGNYKALGVSDPYYKFGNTFLISYDNEDTAFSLNNHDMRYCYYSAVNEQGVDVTIDRKAGVLEGSQWWKLSGHFLNIDGGGEIYDVNYCGPKTFDRYKEEVKYINIHDGITKIGCVFNGCNNAETLTLNKSVTDISDYAFSSCVRLKTVYYRGTREQWDKLNVDYSKNAPLKNATLYCLEDPKPPEDENYWQTVVTEYGEHRGTCGPELYYVLIDGNLDILGNGPMYDYFNKPGGSPEAAPWGEDIKSVSFYGEITSIGNYAFFYSDNITSLTIPDSVTSVGDWAFYGCDNLATITVPESLARIGKWAFGYCRVSKLITNSSRYGVLHNHWKSTLKEVVVLDGATTICNYAFSGCAALTSVTIPDSVTSIGSGAFSGCAGLTSVTIPDGVTSIDSSVFSGCAGLTSVTIPDSVTSIDDYAFEYCIGLTSVTIPDGVTSIDSGVFSGCRGLTSIEIPDSVTSIGSGAFSGCTGLTSVTIPDSVTNIGDWAFSSCTGLTNVTIPDSVTSIGENVFSDCTSITQLTTGMRIATNCGIKSLNSVLLLDTVADIDDYAFSYCANLTSVTIPDSVTSIGNGAFNSCTGLTSVTIPDSVTSVSNYTFYGCTGLTSVTIGNGVTSIGDYAFSDCSGLTSVTIGNGVMSIGYEAFRGCTSLTSVTIPDGVTSIGSGAFSGCAGLTSVTIPDGVTSIDSSVFSGCRGLTSIEIPDSVTSIGNYSFSGCTGLTSVTIPASVANIGDKAFKYFDSDDWEYHPLAVKLRVYEDSYAHRYAIKEGFDYELITPALTKGDADGDGEITVADALAALRIAARLAEPTPELIAICDTDGDGAITVADALAILRVAARIVPSL